MKPSIYSCAFALILSLASASSRADDSATTKVRVGATVLFNLQALRNSGQEITAAEKEDLFDWYSRNLTSAGLSVAKAADCQLFIRQPANSATPTSIRSCQPSALDPQLSRKLTSEFLRSIGAQSPPARGGRSIPATAREGGADGGGVD